MTSAWPPAGDGGAADEHPTAPRFSAIVALTGLGALSAFQLALALGAPLGRAAWGGLHPGRLPGELRAASAVSCAVWLVAATTVAARARQRPSGTASRWGSWVVVAALALGTAANLASSSRWERLGWAPVALILTISCGLVARRH